MKILTVVGARPQFIKAAPVSRQLRKEHQEILLHTGQHYDYGMSKIFFEELEIPEPDYNLNIGSGSHGRQTGQMLIKIEEVLFEESPDMVIVYGDTNSTLAGALAAGKLKIPLVHIEAGMRSFTDMPEEINRVLTDHLSRFLFCSTGTAVKNLEREGLTEGIYLVGDVMYDALLHYREKSEKEKIILKDLGIRKGEFLLLTLHRAENTDNINNLHSILDALATIEEQVIFPVHPRTEKVLKEAGIFEKIKNRNIIFIEPIGYLKMLYLERASRMIITDSGGVQKEAYILGVPCVTLREETEWVETVQAGWNILAGTERRRIIRAVREFKPLGKRPFLFGDGKAALKIASIINQEIMREV